MSKRAAPPRGPVQAMEVIADELEWIFGLAVEMTGSHAPYEMDSERECIEAVRKAVTRALTGMPRAALVELSKKLHELSEAKEIAVYEAERDYELEQRR